MTVDVVTLGLGAALLAGGVDWRVRTIRRRRADFRRRARAALEDHDRVTRRAAVAVVTQRGLTPVTELLLDTIGRESDAGVLDAIAEAVARNQWEPSHRPEVFELRLWAQRRLEERATRQREQAPAREQRYPALRPRAANGGELTEAAVLLCELLESGGQGPAAASPASRGRGLLVMAADGWRRLRLPRTPPAEQRRELERGR